MKSKISTLSGLIAVLCIVFIMGCNEQKSETSQAQDSLVLKTYKVPIGLERDIYNDLYGLLAVKEGEQAAGKVKISSDGQIMVAAPESFHSGVEEYIERLSRNNPGPTPLAEVHYWMVAGRRSEAPSNLDEFGAIKPALDTIQNKQGPMEFKLLDHVATTSSGQRSGSSLVGANISISQMLYAYHDGSVIVEPTIKWINQKKDRYSLMQDSSLRTKITIKSGELVVLGQMRQEFRGVSIFLPLKDEEKHVEEVDVYYIISAETKK
ncbi:MAG: hypothetical protein GX654_21330 [Desulfatiglans sp.]|jgi:hypothetical protein|nr:hypothetical protein [Desulfatiglans sp.]